MRCVQWVGATLCTTLWIGLLTPETLALECARRLERFQTDVSRQSLAILLPYGRPWLPLAAASEQRPPLFVGSTPREIALGYPRIKHPTLPAHLRDVGEKQALKIARKLNKTNVQFEAWPTPQWSGEFTWVVARWREDESKPWQWLDTDILKVRGGPELPVRYDPSDPRDSRRLFNDLWKFNDLYDKPEFSNIVWIDSRDGSVIAAWLAPEAVRSFRSQFAQPHVLGYALARPTWFNDSPITFVLNVADDEVRWPTEIRWRNDETTTPNPVLSPSLLPLWRDDFQQRYTTDLEIISGEKPAHFPISGRVDTFLRKNSADSRHQLESLVDYLEERYRSLGIQTYRERFFWRGIPQSNLVAVLKGTLPCGQNRPVVLADHVDTAFSEDVFKVTGKRVSTHGADDNVSAVGALLRAAEELRSRSHPHDIWLLHLTGEEFPTDSLGARHFLEQTLKIRRDLKGVILLDMIGWHRKNDRVLQVNAGTGAESVRIAEIILGATAVVSPELKPVYRSRHDERSYLYNTDGIIFDYLGYPIVLLNEHVNAIHMRHPHYHKATDTTANVDISFATAIAKVAIESALRLANEPH